MQIKETSYEEIVRNNERNFVDASSNSVEGPLKYMSKENID